MRLLYFSFLLVMFVFPVLLFSQTKNSKIIIPDNISIRLDKNKEHSLIVDINSFLQEKNNTLLESRLVSKENYTKYKFFFDELKFIENYDKVEDSTFYKPYLNNIVLQEENTYLITISFKGIDEGVVKEKAQFTFEVIDEERGFIFKCPFEFNTKDWTTTQKNEIAFLTKGKFNDSIADVFVQHNHSLADLFEISPYKIQYYKCKNLQEAYRLFGIDYHVDLVGSKRGCVTIPDYGIFVSGTDKEEYCHDLTHYYFGLQIDKNKRNWTAEEGYNINLTDYWGYSAEENYRLLRSFLEKSKATPLDIFEKNRIMWRPIPTKMPVAGIIMKKIEREFGMKAVLKIISCGNTNDDFFKAIENVAGISKKNFNEVVLKELYLE